MTDPINEETSPWSSERKAVNTSIAGFDRPMRFGALEFNWWALPRRGKVLVAVASTCATIAAASWFAMQWVSWDAFYQPLVADTHYRYGIMVKGHRHFISDMQLMILRIAFPLLCTMGAISVGLWFLLRRFARPDFPTAGREDGRSRWTE